MANLNTLLPDVLGRIEEAMPTATPPGPVFWQLVGEVYPKMVDAMFDASLVTGIVQAPAVPFTIAAGTTYFSNPKGMVAPLRLKAPYPIRKVMLSELDKMLPNWQQLPAASQIQGWFPLGCSGFGIYPQLTAEASVTMDWITSPCNVYRPYNGTENVPFQVEFIDLIPMYAAAILRSKEGGAEAEEANVVLGQYMSRLKDLSLFEDRITDLDMSAAYGGRGQVNPRSVV